VPLENAKGQKSESDTSTRSLGFLVINKLVPPFDFSYKAQHRTVNLLALDLMLFPA